MISNKVFAMNMDLLSLNFDFAIKDGYDSFIYNLIKDKTNDEQFSKMIQDVILSTTKEEWNKKYGFSGVMSAADFIRLLKSENSAEDEVELLITKANFITDKIPTFQNQITQLVANSRIKQVRFDLYDNYNPNKRSRDIIKKELISLWNATKKNYNQDKKNLVAIEGEVKSNEDNSSNHMIENLILQFLIDNKTKCEIALKDGWLGYPWRDKGGLIGYIRYSFHMQNRILLLNKKQITEKDYHILQPFELLDAKLIVPFFKGDYFKNEVIKNNKLKPFYKKDHFDIIKKRNHYIFKNMIIDDFINAFKKSINN
jgi:hypothetical protein